MSRTKPAPNNRDGNDEDDNGGGSAGDGADTVDWALREKVRYKYLHQLQVL